MKKYQNYICCISIICFLIFVKPHYGNAQMQDSIDNGYFVTYPNQLMVRLYLLQRYAPFTISSSTSDNELKYKTASQLNLGAGVSYKSLTLNLSFGLKLFKEKEKGNTKGLDLQFHLYPQKWVIDLLGSFRKGYYLDPKNITGLTLSDYYVRPDVKRNLVGFSIYRVPNSNKFSYRAAVIQNDRQIKSAGSVLFGGEAYFGSMKGDSALVPNKVSAMYPQSGITTVNFVSIGAGVGYAYTLMIAKYFFITGSAIGNLAVNFSTEEESGSKLKKTGLVPNFIYKGAIGYNSDTWSVSANLLGNALFVNSGSSAKEYFLPTGILRFTVAKKLALKK